VDSQVGWEWRERMIGLMDGEKFKRNTVMCYTSMVK